MTKKEKMLLIIILRRIAAMIVLCKGITGSSLWRLDADIEKFEKEGK